MEIIRFINITWSKGNDFTTPNGEEVPYGLLSSSYFYCQNLITVAPVTRDEEICQSQVNELSTSWAKVPIRPLWMRFTCCPNLVFLAFPWLEIYRCSNWLFSDFDQFKIDRCLSYFGQVIGDPIRLILLILDRSQLFTEFGQHIRPQQTILTLSLWKKIQEPHIGSGTRHFQWFGQWFQGNKNWLGSLVNK